MIVPPVARNLRPHMGLQNTFGHLVSRERRKKKRPEPCKLLLFFSLQAYVQTMGAFQQGTWDVVPRFYINRVAPNQYRSIATGDL